MSTSARFHALLREHGIDEFSPTIPPGVGKHLQGVVYEEDLHKIPSSDENIEYKEQINDRLDSEEMKKLFTEAELKYIAISISHQKPDYSLIHGRELDVTTQFQSSSDFIHFKKAAATAIEKECVEMGLDNECVKICSVPQCLNSTIPNFDYCITHISLDKKFEEQKFVHTCTNKKGCGTPCVTSQEFCPIHRLPGK